MNTSKGLLLLIIGLALAAGGCGRSDELEPEPTPQASVVAVDADTTGAAIWVHLQESDYRNTWTLWPGKGELYTGREPHGMLLTTYLNDVALEAWTNITRVSNTPSSGLSRPQRLMIWKSFRSSSALPAGTI